MRIPRPSCFVGMAVVTGALQDRLDVGRCAQVAGYRRIAPVDPEKLHDDQGDNGQRGDQVDVVNMRFERPEEPKPELPFGMERKELIKIAEILVLGIVGALVLLLVVRPLIARLFEAAPETAAAGAAGLLGGPGAAGLLTGPAGTDLELAEGDESLDEMIDLNRIEGRRYVKEDRDALRIGAGTPADPAAMAFFTRILRITKDDIFHRGEWNLLTVTSEGDDSSGNLAVYEWRSDKAWKVIAINVAGSASQGRVHFGDRPLASKEYAFYDELNDVRYIRSADELRSPGLFVRREGFDAHLFNVSPA